MANTQSAAKSHTDVWRAVASRNYERGRAYAKVYVANGGDKFCYLFPANNFSRGFNAGMDALLSGKTVIRIFPHFHTPFWQFSSSYDYLITGNKV